MATPDKTVDELPLAAALTGAEILYTVQSGVDVQLTIAEIVTLAQQIGYTTGANRLTYIGPTTFYNETGSGLTYLLVGQPPSNAANWREIGDLVIDWADIINKPDLSVYIKKDGSVAMVGDLNLGSNKVINVTPGTAGTDAINKNQLDTKADLDAGNLNAGHKTAWTAILDLATSALQGVVRLADAAAIFAGTAGRIVDAAQLLAAISSFQSRTVSGTTDTVLASDAGRMIKLNSASATTVTCSGLSDGQFVFFMQKNTGQVTFANGTLTVRHVASLTKTAGRYAIIFAYVDGTDFVVVGDMSA